MKIKLLIVFIISITLFSCGKSKEEIELEMAKIELEKAKLEATEKDKGYGQKVDANSNSKLELHKQKVEVGKQKKKNQLHELLTDAESGLRKARRNYEDIKEFRIGRSQSKKNRQLNEASKVISEMEECVRNTKNAIAELALSRTFNFQNKPEDVMKHIFKSALSRDISKFKYLCDPYAENDSDVNSFCMITIFPKSKQEEILKSFEKSRIIGTPKIVNNHAEIEFVYGETGNRLEKMKLVKRMDKWYLSSF